MIAAIAGGSFQEAAVGQSVQRTSSSVRHTVQWEGVPFRDAVARLRQIANVSMFVDRRVDPDRRVTLSVTGVSIDEVIAQLAAASDVGWCRIGNLYYFGPRETAERLPALARARRREIGQAPDSVRIAFRPNREIAWPRFTEPRSFIEHLARNSAVFLEGTEQIPFDLWPAGMLPKMDFADQLTLLLVGFDLTYELRQGSPVFALRPVRWKEIEPQRRAERRRNKPPPAADRTKTQQVYTLRVNEQPVSAVLAHLEKQLKWEVEIGEAALRAAGRPLDMRVSFAVENASASELLEALLAGTGLKAEIEGNRVRVLPR